MKGQVKFYNENKGFGFIAGEDSNDYFFHATGLKQEDTLPIENDHVEFDVTDGKRGPAAENVEIVGAGE